MPPRLDPRRVAAAGLLVLVLVLFLDALRPGRSFYIRDIHAYWSMQAESFVRVLAQGGPPLWNPYVTFGVPMLADPSYQVAYPFTWLNLALGPAGYFTAFALAHTAFAGFGMCLLLRCVGLGWAACFCGAASWIASGAFLVVLSHTHHFAGTAWLPWVLLALDATLRSGSLKAGALLGAAAAGQLLAGSGDLCLMTAFLGLGWILARAFGGRGAGAAAWQRALTSLAAAGAIGAAVSAIQWLPTLAILRSGARLELSDYARFYWSLHPAALADLFVPRLVSELPLQEAARAALFESREPLFAVYYLGAAAVPLALVGVFAGREPWRGFAALGFLAALVLSLGRHTSVYPVIAHVTPLGLLRYPAKYVIMAGFLWAFLVGLGVDAWLEGRLPRRRAIAAALLTLATAALAGAAWTWLAGRPRPLLRLLDPSAHDAAVSQAVARLGSTTALLVAASALVWLGSRAEGWSRLARPCLAALALADLAWVGRGINPTAPSELLTLRPQLLRWVPPASRLWVAQDESLRELKLVRQPLGWERPWAHVLGRVELAWPPTGARAGLLGSYDGDFTGLAPPLVSDLALLLAKVAGRPLALRLLQLGGVQFVVTTGDDPWPGLTPVASIESVFERPIRVLAVPNPRPRLYGVGAARGAAGAAALEILGSAGFDPGQEVVLDRSASFGDPDVPFDGELREIERRPDRIVADTVSNGTVALVALEAFYAGWRAELDGREVPVLRANALFNAVVVPAGRHRVVLAYRPRSVLAGAAVSVAGLAVLAGLALSSLPFRRARVA